MFKGQTIDSGDNSTNIQGKEVNIIKNIGMSYSEVKDIAMDVFKSNFYDLGEKVEKIIQDRAERILDDYLKELNSRDFNNIIKTKDPDIRYVVYEAQKNYARRGDKISKDLLVEILVDRTTIEENSIEELVLNEALNVIPKITYKEIIILTLIFITKHINYKKKTSISIFSNINSIIRDGLIIDENTSMFDHLEYTSCINSSIIRVCYNGLIEKKFPQIKNDKESKNVISRNKELSVMEKIWDNSQFCNSSLTSVGMAIAIANINIKTELNLELGDWIKE